MAVGTQHQSTALAWRHIKKPTSDETFSNNPEGPISGLHRGSHSVFNVSIIVRRTKGYHACMKLIWALRGLSLKSQDDLTMNDLIRVVTYHAAFMASGSLTHLVGCGVASKDSYKVRNLQKRIVLTHATDDVELVLWNG